MKCPKCGYNSFDHLDRCKKCAIDLTQHKARFGIKSVLLAEAFQDDLSAENFAAAVDEQLTTGTVLDNLDEEFDLPETAEGEDFGFDFMGDSDEEEDLAFDELFEDVPTDETTEESLPSPAEPRAADSEKKAPADLAANESAGVDESHFDFDEDDPREAVGTELGDDFDFGDADPDADIFAETDDFLLDEVEPEAEPKKS